MRFEVKAIKHGEGVVALDLDASDAQDARIRAQQQGYSVLTVRSNTVLSLLPGAGATRFPLLLFSHELLALLDAGLSLVEALQTLTAKESRPEVRTILDQTIAALFEGRTLSAALEQFPKVFPPLYVATIRASERSGGLPESLSRYIAYQSQLDLVRKKLVSASIYPVLLLSVGALVTLFLMAYVVPRFSKVYQNVNTELPFLSRLLIKWGDALDGNSTHIVLAAVAIAVAGVYWARHPATRKRIGSILWSFPQLGERMRVYRLARFYRTLGMLQRGGIPIVAAIEMASGLLPHSMGGALAGASASIREGRSISGAMEINALATPVALRMLRVGERTGRMGEMMERIAAFHDEELARWVEWFTRLFEPILMAAIGLVIGLIVIMLYMPIFELAGSIQ